MKLGTMIFGLGLLLVAACKSGDGGGTGGAGGGSGGGANASADCDGVCDSLFAQGCFYAGGEADCRMSCNGWEEQYVMPGPDYCQKAWSDYKACVVSETLTCPDDFNPDWNALPCRPHWDHFQNYCIQKSATPDTPCMENEGFNAFCADQPSKPTGKVCRGDVPADCVVGGNGNNADLYCCP